MLEAEACLDILKFRKNNITRVSHWKKCNYEILKLELTLWMHDREGDTTIFLFGDFYLFELTLLLIY